MIRFWKVGGGGAVVPDVTTQPDRGVCTVTKFSDDLEVETENLTNSYRVELIMAIPREAFLFPEITGIDLCALEA